MAPAFIAVSGGPLPWVAACATVLLVRLVIGNGTAGTNSLFIRGKNPREAIARAYINANVDEEFQPYACNVGFSCEYQ